MSAINETSPHRARSESQRSRREQERLHILATLREHGPLFGVEVVKIANDECVHDAFDCLPDLTNRGVGQKLQGLEDRGLASGAWPGDRSPRCWSITDAGRAHLARGLAALDGSDR